MNRDDSNRAGRRWRRSCLAALHMVAAALLVGCGSSSNNDEEVVPPPPDRVAAGPGGPVATIRRTTNGIPHIRA